MEGGKTSEQGLRFEYVLFPIFSRLVDITLCGRHLIAFKSIRAIKNANGFFEAIYGDTEDLDDAEYGEVLKKKFKEVDQDCQLVCNHSCLNAALKMDGYAAKARAEDTHRMKELIPTLLDKKYHRNTGNMVPGNKSNRGWNNDATAELLCPAGRDWSDPA